MIARRVLSSVISRAGHVCMRSGTCKHCIAANTIVRTFATKPARQNQPRIEEFDLGTLSKGINRELEEQKNTIENEALTISRVHEDYSRLIKDNNIKIEEVAEDEVKITIPKENGLSYVLKFDPTTVANTVNENISAEEEEEQDEDVDEEGISAEEEEEDNEYDNEMEDEYGDEKAPFDMTVEVHREGVAKQLHLQVEISPSMEKPGDYDMYVVDATIAGADGKSSAFTGPSYHTLEEKLKDNFDQLVNKNFGKFIPLIGEYSRVKEAGLYMQWLEDVKQVISK